MKTCATASETFSCLSTAKTPGTAEADLCVEIAAISRLAALPLSGSALQGALEALQLEYKLFLGGKRLGSAARKFWVARRNLITALGCDAPAPYPERYGASFDLTEATAVWGAIADHYGSLARHTSQFHRGARLLEIFFVQEERMLMHLKL